MVGRKSQYSGLSNEIRGYVEARATAIFSAAFAELSLSPHPWSQSDLDHIGRRASIVASMFQQINASESTLASTKAPQVKITTKVRGRITPDAIDIPYSFQNSTMGAYKVQVTIKPGLASEIDKFLMSELCYQFGFVTPYDQICARPNRIRPPEQWKEKAWDFRVRLTDFISRFASRKGIQDPNPFTVFFVEPIRKGSSILQARSGLIGFQYSMDDGQRAFLKRNGTTWDEQELKIPFPNGLCGQVFMSGRPMGPKSFDDASYSYNQLPVLEFERQVIRDSIIFEIPVFAPGLLGEPTDGPDLIIVIKIRPLDSGESSGVMSNEEWSLIAEFCQLLARQYVPAPAPAVSNFQAIDLPSPGMQKVREHAAVIARDSGHVLIIGSSGSGKSTVAEELHKTGPRAGRICNRVSGGVFLSELSSYQLFGHTSGAFTGAAEAKAGYLETTRGGTLIIDDLDALPHDAQARLLLYIDSNKFAPLGDNSGKMLESDVQIIATTNVAVTSKTFRQDFIYRFSHVITIPNLDDRHEDLPFIISSLVQRKCQRLEIETLQISPCFLDAVKAVSWDGGEIRLLRRVVDLAVVLNKDGGMITEDTFEAAKRFLHEPLRKRTDEKVA